MKNSRFRKGEIYLFDLADSYINVQSGLRPCLIIQNELGNIYSPTVIVVPITTKIKKTDLPVHVMTIEVSLGIDVIGGD